MAEAPYRSATGVASERELWAQRTQIRITPGALAVFQQDPAWRGVWLRARGPWERGALGWGRNQPARFLLEESDRVSGATLPQVQTTHFLLIFLPKGRAGCGILRAPACRRT